MSVRREFISLMIMLEANLSADGSESEVFSAVLDE